MAKAYRIRVETELNRICQEILGLIDASLIPTSSSGECKVTEECLHSTFLIGFGKVWGPW